jgi:hypothetical protein
MEIKPLRNFNHPQYILEDEGKYSIRITNEAISEALENE